MLEIFTYNKKNILSTELQTVVLSVLEIVEKHDPVSLKIESFYTKLQESVAQLDSYSNNKRIKHRYSEQIIAERKRRLSLIRLIESQIRLALKSDIAQLSNPGKLMSPVLSRYFNKINALGSGTVGIKVRSFLTEYNGNQELTEAAVSLNIQLYINDLNVVNEQLMQMEKSRNAENSEFRKFERKEFRNVELKCLDNLFTSIKLASIQNAGIDYSGLISELNEFLVNFNAIALTRGMRTKTQTAINEETVASSTKTTATAL